MEWTVGGGGDWWDRRGAFYLGYGLYNRSSYNVWLCFTLGRLFYSAFGQALSTSLEVILGLVHFCKQVLLPIFFDLEGHFTSFTF